MALLYRILFGCPKCWQVLGSVYASVSFAMLMAGWRLAGRAERAERKTGIVINLEQVLATSPLPIPVTTGDFVLTALSVAAGLYLMWFGRWIKNQT